eukprot:10588169-Prorocentrum_lima.AAC.1
MNPYDDSIRAGVLLEDDRSWEIEVCAPQYIVPEMYLNDLDFPEPEEQQQRIIVRMLTGKIIANAIYNYAAGNAYRLTLIGGSHDEENIDILEELVDH